MGTSWQDQFAFIMPTRNRSNFVRRALGFLQAQSYGGRIVLVDASDEDGLAATGAVIGDFPGLDTVHFRPARLGHAWSEIAEALEDCARPFVQLHHDDDFYFMGEVETAVGRLQADPGAASAEGRFVFIEALGSGHAEGFQLAAHDRFAYSQATPGARALGCLNRYCHLSFGVVRRETLAFAMTKVAKHLAQGWFDQFALSALIAAQGGALLGDGLYGIRQIHAGQHHKQLQSADAYRHWPLIVAAPDFSATYADFKACLLDGLGELEPAGDRAALAGEIDQALIALVHRAAGQGPERDTVDAALLQRCNQAGSPEHQRITQAIAAIRQHPDTAGG